SGVVHRLGRHMWSPVAILSRRLASCPTMLKIVLDRNRVVPYTFPHPAGDVILAKPWQGGLPMSKPADRLGERRLWSLWEMLEFNAADFMVLMQAFSNTETDLLRHAGALPPQMREVNETAADAIKTSCEKIGLTLSADSVVYILNARTVE